MKHEHLTSCPSLLPGNPALNTPYTHYVKVLFILPPSELPDLYTLHQHCHCLCLGFVCFFVVFFFLYILPCLFQQITSFSFPYPNFSNTVSLLTLKQPFQNTNLILSLPSTSIYLLWDKFKFFFSIMAFMSPMYTLADILFLLPPLEPKQILHIYSNSHLHAFFIAYNDYYLFKG